jgi:antitoxin (DNA-binding transcriptional repressor) of toxin-antitoxin stability system
MAVLTISEARAALPEGVTRAADGEEITITRHGAPVAVMVRPDIVWARSSWISSAMSATSACSACNR